MAGQLHVVCEYNVASSNKSNMNKQQRTVTLQDVVDVSFAQCWDTIRNNVAGDNQNQLRNLLHNTFARGFVAGASHATQKAQHITQTGLSNPLPQRMQRETTT